ncbi:hypothetical protein CC1G_09083 [Coprinopsis cinerea okayama7|uniref:F-box domain-containing protein n=1 Tax=Coprinopsis cinerea (strain Okayama-7 / 130 / ATCC MYA-4618 / FGSC 9003) TaxID=240176 RepID=A8P326_COPC7|nr:hypothetical protein CC1G_09083 [Coprinopsis cinerea okayama7\|eukprot:XP_001838455.2 hypothetical protein CC1G_09083 [Coprinopsis cinerea okayama7\
MSLVGAGLPPSPYSQLLDTNYAPNDDQVSDIRSLVKSLQEQLARLDDVPPILIHPDYRRQLRHYINQHTALVSPIRRVPEDILREIFIATIPRVPRISCQESPQILGWVCRRWRGIALSTPRLWSVVEVSTYFDPSSQPAGESRALRRCSALLAWLERSKSIPVRLWLHEGPTAIARTFLQPFTHRIGVLRQEIGHSNPSSLLLAQGQFQNLRCLHVENRAGPEDLAAVLCDGSLLDRTPNLDAVFIQGRASSPFMYALHWSRMTSFRWSTCNSNGWLWNDQTLKLLESMPSLRRCQIDQTEGQARAIDTESHRARRHRLVSLPQLESLCLRQKEGGPMTVDVFLDIDAPLLHHLSFAFIDPISLRAPSIKAQTLRRVDIAIDNYTTQELIGLLSSMSSLEELTLRYRPDWMWDDYYDWLQANGSEKANHGFNDRVLKSLTAPTKNAGTEFVCPRLRTLEIDDFDGLTVERSNLTTEAFMAFIVERSKISNAHSRLAHIRLPYPLYVFRLQGAFQAWKEAGNGNHLVQLEFRHMQKPYERPYSPEIPPI